MPENRVHLQEKGLENSHGFSGTPGAVLASIAGTCSPSNGTRHQGASLLRVMRTVFKEVDLEVISPN